MTICEAKSKVCDVWQGVIQKAVSYSIEVKDARTEEHSWGWVFCFGPVDSESPKLIEEYAIDRLTGESIPVGTKGLVNAVHILMSWRTKLGVECENQNRESS